MLIPLIIFIFYNVKIVFKKWEIKRVVVVVVCCCLHSNTDTIVRAMAQTGLDLHT